MHTAERSARQIRRFMLTLVALSRRFGGLRVIDGLDLTVEAGEILGILGFERGR